MPMSMSYLRVHCWLRWAFGPFSGTSHRLTSPKVRTFHVFSPARTKRKSAPFRVGYLRTCGPIRPVTGRRSLFPSSHTLCSIPLPYGRATTYVGSIGLTQLSMKKNVSGTVGACTPVSMSDVAIPTGMRWSSSRTFWLWPVSLFGHFGFTRFDNDASLAFNLTGLPSFVSALRLAENATLSPELRTSDYSSARLGRDTRTSRGSKWFLVSLFDTSSQTL